jgi:type II secretory pathway predicted ATPase ExeA
MYLDFFNLKDKPFRITCDPKYLWLCEKHKEALAMLRYGIMDNRGFLLLTGEVGTGKTLLVNQLLTLFPEDTVVATLFSPDLTSIDFYRMLGDGFKLASPIENKATFLIQLREFLHETAAQDKSVALIVDEAQQLNHHLMEEIRTLSNIELPERKLINIFLIGQPELNQVLSQEENRALSQRITLRYHIEPLNRDETGDYIRHRLAVAGSSEIIFKDNAIDNIFEYTAGIPRLINILCDHAMLTGSVADTYQLDAEIIIQCAQELRVPAQQKSISNFRYTSKPTDPAAGSISSGGLSLGKEARTKEDTTLLGGGHIDIKQKSFGRLKWAFLGIVLVIAISLTAPLINMNDKVIPHGHNNDMLKHNQRETSGSVNSSKGVNEEKLTSQDGNALDGANTNVVGPTMSPDNPAAQDQELSLEKAQGRSPLQFSIPAVIPDSAMEHPGNLEMSLKEKLTNQVDQARQIAKSSPAEIDDVPDKEYLTQYNEDK